MADSIRTQLVEAIQSRLYSYAWGSFAPAGVYLGRSIFDTDSDPLPLITIVPGVEDSEVSRYGTDLRIMPVDISAIISLDDGADVTAVCEPIYAEVHKAVFNDGNQIQIGSDYFSIEFRGGGIVEYPAETGPAVVTVGVSLEITYETAIGDPYN